MIKEFKNQSEERTDRSYQVLTSYSFALILTLACHALALALALVRGLR
jgi:hypothetical protein